MLICVKNTKLLLILLNFYRNSKYKLDFFYEMIRGDEDIYILKRMEYWDVINVRELENVVQRAVVLLQGDEITINDLVFGNQAAIQPEPDRRYSHLKGNEEDIGRMLANRPIADIERIAILATLERTGGNKTEAARRLGVTADCRAATQPAG